MNPNPETSPSTSGPAPDAIRARRIQLAVYWTLLAIGSHLPQLLIGEKTNQIGVFQIDKTLHVIGFAGLAYLLYRAHLISRDSARFRRALIATIVAGVYALIDEYTQHWTGRNVSFSDIVAGLIGILGVFLILTAPDPKQRADRSTQQCRAITLGAVIVIGILALAPNRPAWLGLGPGGHFYAAALLTLLLIRARPAGVHRPGRGVLLSIIAIGLIGPIIESAQPLAGRSAEMANLFAHQLGLLTAMAALTLLAVFKNLAPQPGRQTSSP